MADYSGNLKLCATCAYWIAQRDVNQFNTHAVNCASEGRCAIPQGPFRHSMRLSNSCACMNYLKWPVLKQ